MVGPYKGYYENGNLSLEVSYGENGDAIGPFKHYYKNGNLKAEGIFVGNSSDGGDPYEISEGKSYKKNGKYKEIFTFSLD
jgi:antitoxin component YwqK of YwqJK toxin-antitoxin module